MKVAKSKYIPKTAYLIKYRFYHTQGGVCSGWNILSPKTHKELVIPVHVKVFWRKRPIIINEGDWNYKIDAMNAAKENNIKLIRNKELDQIWS